MNNFEPQTKPSMSEHINQAVSHGKLHPDIAERMLRDHEKNPRFDYEELLCRIVAPPKTTTS